MKIVYDGTIFYQQRFGGISRYFANVARALSRQPCYDISVIAPLHINESLHENKDLTVKGFKLPSIKGTRPLARHTYRALGGTMINRERPDIIHETYYTPEAYGKLTIPRVVTVYDMIHEKFPPILSG